MESEALLRLSAFLGMLALMGAWETLAPRRARTVPRLLHWANNLGMVVLNTVVVRLLFPVAATGVAAYVQGRGWGLLNLLEVPGWLAFALAFVLLDLAIYLQHVAFHYVPWLWRLHRMHHADPDFDVTTGVRFHPVEIVLSLLIKFAVITALGAPAAAVVAFEVALNATAMFNHANARVPLALDRVLRLFVVTPDMHRVHHSVVPAETNSNFGFNLPWWDRLFRTYRAQPRAGHDGMQIGLTEFRDARRNTLIPGMLLIPFRDPS